MRYIIIIICLFAIIGCKKEKLENRAVPENIEFIENNIELRKDEAIVKIFPFQMGPFMLGMLKDQIDSIGLSIDIHKMNINEKYKKHKLGNIYPIIDSVYIADNGNLTSIPSFYFYKDTLVGISMFAFLHSELDKVLFEIDGVKYSNMDLEKIKAKYKGEIQSISDFKIKKPKHIHEYYYIKNKNLLLLIVEEEIRVVSIFL